MSDPAKREPPAPRAAMQAQILEMKSSLPWIEIVVTQPRSELEQNPMVLEL
jgi:hypothetical protein